MIELILINSLVCVGVYYAAYYSVEDKTTTDYSGNIYKTKDVDKGFFWFMPYLLRNAPRWVQKPFYDCLMCMASIHSLYVYWAFRTLNMANLIQYPIFILALAGLNYVVSTILSKLEND